MTVTSAFSGFRNGKSLPLMNLRLILHTRSVCFYFSCYPSPQNQRPCKRR